MNELEKALTLQERKIFPSETSSSRCNLPWFNRAHRRLCKKKQRLYNAAKRSDKDKDSGPSIEQLTKMRQELTKARNEQVSGILTVDGVQGNPKSFWSYVKMKPSQPVQPGSCEEALSLFRLQNEM